MTYGLKYKSEFDSIVPPHKRYTLEIHKSNYEGGVQMLTHGSDPVIHTYTENGLMEPIQGSQLTISFVGVPLTAFISDSDFDFKVILKQGAHTKFVGYLMQDDYTERTSEYTHEITLTAVDGLGILKAKSLSENELYVDTPDDARIIVLDPDERIIYFDNVPADYSWVRAGNKFVVKNSSFSDGEYTIEEAIVAAPGTYLRVIEPLPGDFGFDSGVVHYRVKPDLFLKYRIADYFLMCLSVTRLDLGFDVYSTLKIANGAYFTQSLIDAKTFLTNDTDYMNCYDVLSRILKSFRATLMQRDGRWVVMRWSEFKDLTHYMQFRSDFELMGNMPKVAPVGSFTLIEGAVNGYVRQCRMIKETFDLAALNVIIRNLNFLDTGRKLRDYTKVVEGETQYCTEYEALYWTPYRAESLPPLPGSIVVITVVLDKYGVEIDRFIESRVGAAITTPALVSEGDVITINLSAFLNYDTGSGNGVINTGLIFTDLSGNRFSLKNSGVQYPQWTPIPATASGNNWGLFFSAGQNAREGVQGTVNNTDVAFPSDGYVQFLLTFGGKPGGTSAEEKARIFYRDISLSYRTFIARTTLIKGQEHLTLQPADSLNVDDEKIEVDISPRLQLKGSLYQNQTTLAREYNTSTQANRKLGEIVTRELMTFRSRTRQTIEGEILVEMNATDVLNREGKNYFATSLEVDYKYQKVSGKFVELWGASEGVDSNYKFRYIYESIRR